MIPGAEGLEWRRLLSAISAVVVVHPDARVSSGDGDANEGAPNGDAADHRVDVKSVVDIDADDAKSLAFTGGDQPEDFDAEAGSGNGGAQVTPGVEVANDVPPPNDPSLAPWHESGRHESPAGGGGGTPPGALPAAPASPPVTTSVAYNNRRIDERVPQVRSDPGVIARGGTSSSDQGLGANEEAYPAIPMDIGPAGGNSLVGRLIDEALASLEPGSLADLDPEWSDVYRVSLLSAGAVIVGSVVIYRRLHAADHDRQINRAAASRPIVPGLWPPSSS